MHLKYYIVDVFTKTRFGGNPLAVVLDADAVSDSQMQSIAAEFNFSETAFINKPQNQDAVASLRIFTPKMELPIAGHPIIGSCAVLIDAGIISLDNTNRFNVQIHVPAGNVPVRIDSHDNQRDIFFGAPLKPEFDNNIPAKQNIAAVLGLNQQDVQYECVQRVYHGNWTLVVPLHSYQALKNIQHQSHRHNELLAACAADQLYPIYIHDDPLRDVDVSVRMFYTDAGITEDPATGSAAISLSAWLANQDSQFNAHYSWTISQGSEINRPSFIKTSAVKENGDVIAIRVGGNSVLIAKGELFLK